MIESYKIGVSLILDSNINQALGGVLAEFEKINAAVANTRKNVTLLAEAFAGLNASAARAASSVNSMSSALPNMSGHASQTADHFERASRALATIRTPGYGLPAVLPPGGGAGMPPLALPPPGGGNGAAGNPGDMATTGFVAGAVSSTLMDAIDALWKSTADVGAIKSRMLQAGFSKEQAEQAVSAAFAAQQNILGVTVPGAMEAQLDIATLIRDPDKARKIMPELAGLSVVLAQAHKGDQTRQLFEAVQAGELRGALVDHEGKINPEKLAHFVREVEATFIATGARIGPREILGFLQNSGVAGRVIGDDALFGSMIPAMLSMDTKKAGTGLQAFYQHFGVGKGSDASWNFLNEMGLITDPSKVVKYGIGQRQLLPGGMKGEEQVKSGDVFGFITQVLLPAIRGYNETHYGRTDSKLEATTAQVLSSRIPEAKLLADLISLIPLASAYTGAVGAASQRDALGIAQDTNPHLAASGLGAALQGVLIAAGQADLDVATNNMKSLKDVLDGLAKVAKANPDEAKLLVDLVTYTAGFAGVLALFAVGSVAITALGALAAPAGLLFGLGAAAVAAADGVGKLDRIMHDWFPESMGAADKTRAEIKTNGMQVPWWWPLPTGSNNTREAMPWSHNNPMPVIVQNSHEIGSAVSGGLGDGATRPATGPSSFNASMDLSPHGVAP